MTRIVLASSNRGKLKEFSSILKLPDTDLIAQSEFGVVDAEETGCTFVENALIKALDTRPGKPNFLGIMTIPD